MALNYVQTNTLYQAGSGNIIGATSIVLTALTDIYGNVLTMTDFGAKGYGTCEPDTNNEESFTFTGITANANGTYTLTGVSSALAISPYTESSGLVRQHSGGTKVVISDTTAFWNTFANTQNANTFAATQTFSVPAVQATDPTTSSEVANKHYVDGVAVSGAPNASTTVKGIVQEATQAQILSKTQVGSTGADLYVSPLTLPSTLLSDYKVDTGSANAYAIAPAPAITAYTAGQIFSFKAVNANTGASTLNVNALGTETIKNALRNDLVANDILAGQIVVVEYDGTNMIMISPSGNMFTAKALRSATTIVDTSAATAPSANQVLTATDSTHATWVTPSSASASGSITYISSTTPGNTDETITLGFQPSTIQLFYYITGHTANAGTNVVTSEKGMAVFSGASITGTYIHDDNGTIDSSTVNSSTIPQSGENDTSAGSAYGSLIVLSVSSTGFVARKTINSGSGTATITAMYIAWK